MRTLPIATDRPAPHLAGLARIIATEEAPADRVNQGRALRHGFGGLAAEPGLALAIALFSVQPRALPFTVDLLEVHRRSEQLILPVRDVPGWIALVAPDRDGRPDPDRARAVALRGDQGIVYAAGTWHLPIFLTGPRAGLFLVQSLKDGSALDCIEHELGPDALLLTDEA